MAAKKYDGFKEFVTKIGVVDIVDKASDGQATADDIDTLKEEFTQPDTWHAAEDAGMFDESTSPKYTITYKSGNDEIATKQVTDAAGDGYTIKDEDIAAVVKEGTNEDYKFTFSNWKKGTKAVVKGDVIKKDTEFKAGTVAGFVRCALTVGVHAQIKSGEASSFNIDCTDYGYKLTQDKADEIKAKFVADQGYTLSYKIGEDNLDDCVGVTYKTGFTVTATGIAAE